MKNLLLLLFGLFVLQGCIPTSYHPSKKADIYSGKYDTFLDQGEIVIKTLYHKMYSQDKNGNFVLRTFYPEKNKLHH